jgi:integrase
VSIYKRKGSDTYTVDFRYKRVRVSADTGCTSKAEAREWQRQKKAEIDANPSLASLQSIGSRLNLGQARDRFVKEHLQFASGFEKSEKWRLAKVIERLGESMRLEDLSTAHIKMYVAVRQKDGASPATINREITNIRALWGHAMDIWEYPVRAIAWRRVRPPIPKRVIKVPKPADLRRLMAAATPRLQEVILFALSTGFRRHEIQKLTAANVDLEARTLTIIGKGNKEATVPMSSATASLLSSMLHGKSLRVFDMTNFRREWDAAKAKAGLRRLRFHDLRHAFATMLSELDAPVQRIKDGMRHSDIDTTLIYDHAGAQALSPFLEKLGNKLLENLQDKSEE